MKDKMKKKKEKEKSERMWSVREKKVVMEKGEIERKMVFEGKESKGVMMEGEGSKYIKRYGVKVGKKEVIVK